MANLKKALFDMIIRHFTNKKKRDRIFIERNLAQLCYVCGFGAARPQGLRNILFCCNCSHVISLKGCPTKGQPFRFYIGSLLVR